MEAGGAGPGFVFWGLFVVCGLIALAYVGWLLWAERNDRSPRG